MERSQRYSVNLAAFSTYSRMNMRVVLIMAAVAAVLAVDGAFAFPRGRMPRPKPGASTAELDAYLSARAHPPRPLGRIAPEGVVPVPQVHGRPSLPHAKLAVGAADPHASTGSFNVMDYGAKSDCTFSSSSDTTSAFQAALDAAGAANGGVVYAPPGCYVFAGSLVVPPAVALQGSYETVPAHSILGGPPPTNGSVLAPTGGRGSDSGPAFITLPEDAGLAGFSIFYPTQEQVQTPVPFPWTVHMVGMNSFVTDVELLLSWNGINATQAHRHYIARVQGQPINIGVLVDATYDIGRIEDVHFNPWASNKQPFMSYQLTHGRAFVFGRSDWEYVFNTFAFGYAIGYHFIHTATGDMNANLLGIGADLAINASVKVDASQAPGLLITNGEFTAFSTPQWLPNSTAQSTQVVVAATNTVSRSPTYSCGKTRSLMLTLCWYRAR